MRMDNLLVLLLVQPKVFLVLVALPLSFLDQFRQKIHPQVLLIYLLILTSYYFALLSINLCVTLLHLFSIPLLLGYFNRVLIKIVLWRFEKFVGNLRFLTEKGLFLTEYADF